MMRPKKKSKALAFILFAISILPFSVHARDMTEHPRVKLKSLNKITAKTVTFEADIGDTLKFGPLYMKVQSCQKSSPLDEPESAAFIQIWEVDAEENAEWVFSGWMFASSPALSPMDHAIYDVWVVDCLGEGEGSTKPLEGDDTLEDAKITPPPTEQPAQGDMLEDE